MRPKAQPNGEDGLLEYLEDIIGSHRLVPAIEELGKEVGREGGREGGREDGM